MCIPSTSSLLIDAFSTWTLTEHPISAVFLSTTPPFADKSWNCLWLIGIVPLRRLEAWTFRILCKLLMGKWRAQLYYSETIRFSAITVCTVGHRFGHGWAVVVTRTRKVKSVFSEGSKNPRFYLLIDAFSISTTKTQHILAAFCAAITSSARR